MSFLPSIEIKHPLMGVCGLSCRLCPRYQSEAPSRCHGCKTESRLGAACAMQTCALKRHGIEFCGFCKEGGKCEKWKAHRQAGIEHDSFLSYQALERNISKIVQSGADEWNRIEEKKADLLQRLITEYDDGRSRTRFCIAVTVLPQYEIEQAMKEETGSYSPTTDIKARNRRIRAALDQIASAQGKQLVLRK